jgi:hypothetical protein
MQISNPDVKRKTQNLGNLFAGRQVVHDQCVPAVAE